MRPIYNVKTMFLKCSPAVVSSRSSEQKLMHRILFALMFLLMAFATPCGASVLSRVGWVASASASDNGASPINAIDGNINTRWSTRANQTNGQWFQVDMGGGTPPTFTNIVLDAAASSGDYP